MGVSGIIPFFNSPLTNSIRLVLFIIKKPQTENQNSKVKKAIVNFFYFFFKLLISAYTHRQATYSLPKYLSICYYVPIIINLQINTNK